MSNSDNFNEFNCLTTPLSPISNSSSRSSYDSVKLLADEENGRRDSKPQSGKNTKSSNIENGRETSSFSSTQSRNDVYVQTRDECTQTMTTCHRMRMEISKNYHLFSLQEDYDSTMIHVQKSFAPIHYLGIPFFLRLYWWSVTYNCIIQDHSYALGHRSSNIMYFSHLTNITLVLTLGYQTLSCFLCLVAILRRKHYYILYQPPQGHEGGNTRPSMLVCLTWLIYSIVLPGEFIVALGYWTCEADPNHPNLNFINVYKHGIIGILLWLDGNVLGRIPLRLKQLKALLIYGTMYLVWSIYFAYHRLGTHGGVIYRFIDWRRDPYGAAFLSFIFLFVSGPLLYYMFWFLSVCMGKCYCCWYCCPCFYSYGDSNRRVVTSETVRWSRNVQERNLKCWQCCGHDAMKRSSSTNYLELGGETLIEYSI